MDEIWIGVVNIQRECEADRITTLHIVFADETLQMNY